jgi:hypothetical protein
MFALPTGKKAFKLVPSIKATQPEPAGGVDTATLCSVLTQPVSANVAILAKHASTAFNEKFIFCLLTNVNLIFYYSDGASPTPSIQTLLYLQNQQVGRPRMSRTATFNKCRCSMYEQ